MSRWREPCEASALGRDQSCPRGLANTSSILCVLRWQAFARPPAAECASARVSSQAGLSASHLDVF